jgi:hypothetical protein
MKSHEATRASGLEMTPEAEALTVETTYSDGPTLVAYAWDAGDPVEISPARRWRQWMDDTPSRWANRCLPLLVANESGWWLLNPRGFTATWSGQPDAAAIAIRYDEEPEDHQPIASSHFGYGIVTWTIPSVFVAEPGWDLLVRGPANLPKDGASPLEGVVEIDWATVAFTMNWKITRPELAVRFEAGEPFAMLVPQRRHELENIRPHTAKLSDNPALESEFRLWLRRRNESRLMRFARERGLTDEVPPDYWQKDYFKGQAVTGVQAPEHRTKRRLRPFSASVRP